MTVIELAAKTPNKKTGKEKFHAGNGAFEFELLEFWQWSASDLVSNAMRGILAEFIVAKALGIKTDVRNEWDSFDLEMPSGLKIEVKSAGYIQSWAQDKLSPIKFNIPKTSAWDANTGKYAKSKKRQADLYVFALLAHKDKSSIDPLNIDHWEFYVLKTSALDDRKSISLSVLQKLAQPLKFSDLRQAIMNFER